MPLAEIAPWVFVLLSAVVGGAIGSFLNVVVYRLPAGISLSTPPSRCPKCKTPIRWSDNVPVFGWIFLGGRCRSCHCAIPIRYPAVEAATAAMFAGVALFEYPLSATYAVHMLVLSTLLCAVLIAVDGKRPPWRLFVPAAVGVLAWLVWWGMR